MLLYISAVMLIPLVIVYGLIVLAYAKFHGTQDEKSYYGVFHVVGLLVCATLAGLLAASPINIDAGFFFVVFVFPLIVHAIVRDVIVFKKKKA